MYNRLRPAALAPVAGILQEFVKSGGGGSLAVGWFFNSTADADQISPEKLARVSQLGLALDLYLYCAPESGVLAEDGSEALCPG